MAGCFCLQPIRGSGLATGSQQDLLVLKNDKAPKSHQTAPYPLNLCHVKHVPCYVNQ